MGSGTTRQILENTMVYPGIFKTWMVSNFSFLSSTIPAHFG